MRRAFLATLSRTLRHFGLGVALVFMLGTPCQASDAWQADLPAATPIGSGEASWLGIRLYRATLWAPQRPFDASQAFALQLQYHISISKRRLARASIDEIARIDAAIPPETLARWKTLLEAAFIDVGDGDELVGVYLPGRGMRLYDRARLLAEIDDAGLAKAFFGIWLDQATRDAGLRKHLLGEAG